MDTRRFLIAIVVSVTILVVWQKIFPPPEPPSRTPPAEATGAPADASPDVPTVPSGVPDAVPTESRTAGSEAAGAEDAAAAEPPPSAEALMATAEERTTVETDTYRVELTNRGGQLLSFQLREHSNGGDRPVDLVRSRALGPYPFGLVEEGGESSPLNEALFAVDRASAGGVEVVTYRYSGAAGQATKSFRFGGDGLFEVDIELPERQGRSVLLGPGIRNPTAKELENRFARKSAIYATSEDVETVDPNKAKTRTIVPGGGLRWVGLQDTYFLSALVFREPVDQVAFEPMLVDPSGDGGLPIFRPRPEELSGAEDELVRDLRVLVRPNGGRLAAVSFWGPKVYDHLEAQGLGLEEAVALGPFGFLTRPLLFGLRWIHANLVGNWGWAIILMTVLIRILLFPLTHKSVVSMQKMQEVNPKIQSIRQKYRTKLKDKQGRPNPEMQRKMNEEIMALYKREGVNPAGGCLPMLLQLPVLFAFYSLLSTAIELRHAPWFLWIQDLAAPDPIYVLPIIMGGTQFLQQRLTPSAGDPMQRRIFMLMPIFFTILFLGFPSGLVLYWLTNNILGIVQQVVFNRIRERKAAAAQAADGKGKKGPTGGSE